jgi:vancomycin aglycone glucosyltransferase
MRVLLSTIGSRGDVQPLVALASQLKALGQEVRLCVPPDFRDWIEGLGMPVTPIGPEVRAFSAASRPATPPAPPTPEQMRQLMDATVATQFETIGEAAEGCDIIVATTAIQIATRSIAELRGIPYVFAAYSPNVLPSRHHAPPVLTTQGQTPAPATADVGELWARNAESFNNTFGASLNAHRASRGLEPVNDVRTHIFTDHPWLAADPTLAPWPDPEDRAVFQTGAWILTDERPLSPELLAFLDAGEPPVYFGFGSTRAPQGPSQVMIETARALGRRAIVSSGWADLSLIDNVPDCLAIGEVNVQALFRRVAAVVHHGGAGTTTAAARAGVPQVVVPQMYDQFYFAQRIEQLEIGSAHPHGALTTDSLTAALRRALRPEVAVRARAIGAAVRPDGASIAARHVIELASTASV